jgi:hypothetical protein
MNAFQPGEKHPSGAKAGEICYTPCGVPMSEVACFRQFDDVSLVAKGCCNGTTAEKCSPSRVRERQLPLVGLSQATLHNPLHPRFHDRGISGDYRFQNERSSG